MLVVYSAGEYEKEKGFVVDLCAECRECTVHRVVEIGTSVGIYFVPVSKRRSATISHCIRCDSPRVYRKKRDLPYAEVPKRKKLEREGLDSERDFDELQRRTFPDLAEMRSEELARFAALREGAPLRPEQTIAAIVDAFEVHDLLFTKQRMRTAPIEGVGIATMLAGFFCLAFAWHDRTWPIVACAVCVFFGLVLTVIGNRTRRPRSMRACLPSIAQRLVPYPFSLDELEHATTELRARKCKIGRALRPEEIFDELDSMIARARAAVNVDSTDRGRQDSPSPTVSA